MKSSFYTAACMFATCFFSVDAAAQANTDLSNLVAPTKVNVNMLPNNDNTKSLGTAAKSWKDIYMDGIMYRQGYSWIGGSGSSGNTILGADAGFNLLTGGLLPQYNTFIGINSGFATTTGSANTFMGSLAGRSNTTGNSNIFIGSDAGSDNIDGYGNTYMGVASGTRNTSGGYNVGIGRATGAFNKTGHSNTWVGNETGFFNSTGSYNTIVGDSAGRNATASYNTMVGQRSGLNTTTGGYNVLMGFQAGVDNVGGNYNVAVGGYALDDNDASTGNVAVGYSTGTLYTNGNYNTFVGYDADAGSASLTNSTALGNGARITGSNQVRVGNTSVSSIGGYANWTNISDGRVKRNVRENVPGLGFINKLRPVTYNLDVAGIDGALNKNNSTASNEPIASATGTEKQQVLYTGFVAQEVEKAAKEMGYDFSGVDAPQNEHGLYGLRYAEFVVPLVKAVQELSRMNDVKDKIIGQQQQMLTDVMARLEALENKVGAAKDQAVITNSSTTLLQNIPNPVKGITIVQYTLPQGAHQAELVLTDMTGKPVQTFTLGNNNNGQLSINTATLAAGNYLYALVVDGKKIASRQMTVLQ